MRAVEKRSTYCTSDLEFVEREKINLNGYQQFNQNK